MKHPADPTVNVIVPCFNQGRFLPAMLQSLQAQRHPHWRAIVIDDGSTDETPQMCAQLQEHEPRLIYRRKVNGGLSSARNAGLAATTGDFVQFLDADDLLAPGKLATHVHHLQRHPEIAVVFGNATYFEDTDPERTSRDGLSADPARAAVDWVAACAADPGPMLEKLLGRNQFPVPNALVRRSALEPDTRFDETLVTLEDWDFWTRLAISGAAFEYVEAEATDALIRVHGASLSQQKPKMRQGAYQLAARDLARIDAPHLRRVVLARALSACRRGGLVDKDLLLSTIRPVASAGETRALQASLWLHRVPVPYRLASALRRLMPQTFGL